MTFGTRLKAQRKRRRLSGEQLGQLLDPPLSKQTISHWEADRHPPTIDYLTQLCRVLAMSADELIMGIPSPLAMQIASAYEALGAPEKAKLNSLFLAMASGVASQPIFLVNKNKNKDVTKSEIPKSGPYSGQTESDSSAKNSEITEQGVRAVIDEVRVSNAESNKHVRVPRKKGGRST